MNLVIFRCPDMFHRLSKHKIYRWILCAKSKNLKNCIANYEINKIPHFLSYIKKNMNSCKSILNTFAIYREISSIFLNFTLSIQILCSIPFFIFDLLLIKKKNCEIIESHQMAFVQFVSHLWIQNTTVFSLYFILWNVDKTKPIDALSPCSKSNDIANTSGVILCYNFVGNNNDGSTFIILTQLMMMSISYDGLPPLIYGSGFLEIYDYLY